MTENKCDFYYLNPPDNANFHALFSYFWNHGIGRPIKEGIQSPWNKYDLEDAFLNRKKAIDIRSIENWKSGKSVPHVKNLIVLASIAGAGDRFKQKSWSEAFIRAYDDHRKFLQKTNKEVTSPKFESTRSFNVRYALTVMGLALLLFTGMLSASSLRKTETYSHKTILIGEFSNNTDNPELDFFTDGLSTLMTDSLFQIDNLTAVKKSREIAKQNLDAEIECKLFGYKGSYSIVCQIWKLPQESIVWSNRFEFASGDEINEMQRSIPAAVAEVMQLAISDEAIERMKLMGTSNLDSFIAYQKGRFELKNWHSERDESKMQSALQNLKEASRLDRDWSEPQFHLVDIYQHYISGDTEVLSSLTSNEAASEIPRLLAAASEHSLNQEEKFKAKMNSIFFSEDWTGLVNASQKYVDAATKRRGELEWLYEPVILLLIGDRKLTERLLEKRLIKFDPENGTGHAYRARNLLLSGLTDKARQTIQSATTTKFENRIDEIRGFISFYTQDYEDLIDLLENNNHLNALHLDYFSVLILNANGKKRQALELISNSESLNSSEVYLAFAYLHIGESDIGRDLLREQSIDDLGDIELATAIAYGAACGLSREDIPNKLIKKLNQANITLPRCINN